MGVRRGRRGVLVQDLVAHGDTFIANIGCWLAFGATDEFFYLVDRLAAERTTPDKLMFHITTPTNDQLQNRHALTGSRCGTTKLYLCL